MTDPLEVLASLIEDNPELMAGADFSREREALSAVRDLVEAARLVHSESLADLPTDELPWGALADALRPFEEPE